MVKYTKSTICFEVFYLHFFDLVFILMENEESEFSECEWGTVHFIMLFNYSLVVLLLKKYQRNWNFLSTEHGLLNLKW